MAHHGIVPHNYKIPYMSYEYSRGLTEKKLVKQKKGLLSNQEVRQIVNKWKYEREEENLDPGVVEIEVRG